MAKLFACRTFRDVTAMAQQVFGGIGFTVDFDIQLYFRRAKALQVSWWDTRLPRGAGGLGPARRVRLTDAAPTDQTVVASRPRV